MGWILRTILTISAVALPVYLYVGLRVASSIGFLRPGAKRRANWCILGAIAWCFLVPATALVLYLLKIQSALFLPGRSVGFLDYLFYYPSWVSLIIVVEVLPPFLLLDVVTLGSRLIRSRREALRKYLAWARVGLAAFAILYVPLRSAIDTMHVRNSEARVSLPGLPAEFDELRITLFGDIHVDRYTEESKIGQFRRIVVQEHPDLLVSSGDLVSSGTGFLEKAKAAICGLNGSIATIGVMGDHDFWAGPDQVREIQLDCGWIFLQDEHRLIPYRGKTICLSGLTNIYAQRLDAARLDSFLAAAPEADLHILLTHQPANRVIQAAVAHRYDLLLAGHTHGGQIVFHPFGITLTPSMGETRYFTGIHRESSTTVVVTNGVGISIAPLRYHAPAEVTTIILGR
jgi:hypothetical protein